MRKMTIIGLTMLAGIVHMCSTVLFYQEAGQLLKSGKYIQAYFPALPSIASTNVVTPSMNFCPATPTPPIINPSQDIQPFIEKELLKDGLIKDAENYRFKLTKKRLRINGKKQPMKIHQKYVALYEHLTDCKMSDRTTYSVAVSSN